MNGTIWLFCRGNGGDRLKNIFKGVSKKLLLVALLCGVVATAGIGLALLTWTGTISGNIPNFSVWNAATVGSKLDSPYALDVSPVISSPLTFHFWIQNNYTSPMTFTVSGESLINCAVSWSLPSAIPVGSRGEAVLTLTVTDLALDSFSYTWTFTPA
jgi:hypothetical protein